MDTKQITQLDNLNIAIKEFITEGNYDKLITENKELIITLNKVHELIMGQVYGVKNE